MEVIYTLKRNNNIFHLPQPNNECPLQGDEKGRTGIRPCSGSRGVQPLMYLTIKRMTVLTRYQVSQKRAKGKVESKNKNIAHLNSLVDFR